MTTRPRTQIVAAAWEIKPKRKRQVVRCTDTCCTHQKVAIVPIVVGEGLPDASSTIGRRLAGLTAVLFGLGGKPVFEWGAT